MKTTVVLLSLVFGMNAYSQRKEVALPINDAIESTEIEQAVLEFNAVCPQKITSEDVENSVTVSKEGQIYSCIYKQINKINYVLIISDEKWYVDKY